MIARIVTRAAYVIISLFLAKMAFDYFYFNFLSMLPDHATLEIYKDNPASEITSFRKQYLDVYERSLFYSLLVFIFSVLILEYVNATMLFKGIYKSVTDDVKGIRDLNK